MIELSNFFTYLVIALAVGILITTLNQKRLPSIRFTRAIMYISIISIVLLTFVPIVQLAQMLHSQFSVPIKEALVNVITTFQVGHTWITIVVISSILLIIQFVREKIPNKLAVWGQLTLWLCIVYFISLSSHSSASDGLIGILSHLIHIIAFAIWIGPLLIVSWLTKPLNDLKAFHRWFSPLAFIAVSLIILSGLILMNTLVPNYIESWSVSYGQYLLIKHLMFIPILLFGIRHVFLLKWNPLHLNEKQMQLSFRWESLFAVIIFAISAWMTEQPPPHEVDVGTERSPLFLLFHSFTGSENNVVINWSLTGSPLLAIGSLFIIWIGYQLIQKKKVMIPIILMLIILIVIYTGLMLSVTFI
ncbi:copper resistance D family protein [Alkalihalobacillus sp. 1P02AB]|uniref:copper resistance D family protein n=1 Tax=Alkalihalobacillus sp. 1P02AB TaxID=3132260 RepID=UPI0039A435D0